MISRVTLPGRLSATRVGSFRNTVARVSPRSVCTTTLSPILNQRLRELRKNALRAPRSATWTMSDIVDLYGAGEQAQTPAFGWPANQAIRLRISGDGSRSRRL